MPNLGPFLISGLSTGALYALTGVGLVILYRASGVINLAQGAIGALAAIIVWQFAQWHSSLWAGVLVGVLASIVASLAYGRLIAPRLAHSDPIIRAVATLGVALILMGLISLVWGEIARSVRLPTDAQGVRVLGVRITYTRMLAMSLAIAVTAGMLTFLNGTRLGLAMRALANRREISALLGVPILRVDSWAWAISGAIAGLSGILLADLTRMQAHFLTFLVIPAIAAAIVGRMQSLVIAVVAGLVIGIVEAMGTPFPAIAPYRSLAPFVVAILALLWLQRHGLSLIGAAAGLGEVDQRPSGAGVGDGRRELYLRIGLGIVAAALVALVMPEVIGSYWLRVLTSAVVLTLATLAVAIIYAQLGMVSLCQYALVGVGGWFCLRFWYFTGWPFEVNLLIGGVAAAVFGLIFGLPALRMRGLYLALTTLMIAGAFQVVITATDFPDGGPGIFGKVTDAARSFMDRPTIAVSDIAYFRYCVAAVVIGYLIVLWHKRSRAGRAWAMIRRSEACAMAAGVNITLYKVWAFSLAGFLTGICGGLLAGIVGQLDLRTFPTSESVLLFAVTVIGGAYNWLGAIIGALLMRAVPGVLNDWYVDGNVATIVFGAGLLHALITAPHGISGQLLDLFARLRSMIWQRAREQSA